MIRRVSRLPSFGIYTLAFACVLFLALPVLAILGLGLYYSLGIVLVADASQMMAALAKEAGIAPALLATPLIGVMVALLASLWGLCLSFLWRQWLDGRRYHWIIISALPFLLPRFALGALFLLASLKLAQWGGNFLGLALAALVQAAVATPLVAGVLALGWRRVETGWRHAAQESGADDLVIFQKLEWPILKPYAILAAILAFILSLGDFYLGNALSGDAALLPGAIFSGVAQNVSPLYHALVALMVIVDFVLLWVVMRRLKRLRYA